MFKQLKLYIKHRSLMRDAYEAEGSIEQELDRFQGDMQIFLASPQSHVIIEYLEAKVEVARDQLELNIDVIKNQSRLEVYRDLISLFQSSKDSVQAQSKPSSD